MHLQPNLITSDCAHYPHVRSCSASSVQIGFSIAVNGWAQRQVLADRVVFSVSLYYASKQCGAHGIQSGRKKKGGHLHVLVRRLGHLLQ